MLLSVVSPGLYDRLRIVHELLDLCDAGKLTVTMSVVGITELRRVTNEEGSTASYVDEDTAARLATMVASGVIDIRPVTERIALHAQRIGMKFPQVFALDAIHIATALEPPVSDVLFTFDGAGKRRHAGDMIGLSLNKDLADPPLPICPPFVPMGPMMDEAYLKGERVASPEFEQPSELERVAEAAKSAPEDPQ